MRAFGLAMLLVGLALAILFFVVGVCFQVPWGTSSAVLFGLGMAYAGLCGVRSAAVHATASPGP